VKQIKAVPQPVADQAKLAKWTGYLEGETKLLKEIGAALKANKKSKAQSLSVKLTHNGNLANNARRSIQAVVESKPSTALLARLRCGELDRERLGLGLLVAFSAAPISSQFRLASR